MRYKSFCVWFLCFLIALVVFNYMTWKCCTEVLLTKKFDGGDMARMGYALKSKQYRKAVNDLPRRHIIMSQYSSQQVEVLTIGDSFSMGGGEGKNNFYQDYIATLNGCTVLNVPPYPSDDLVVFFSPFSTLEILINSGYLDRIKPKYVIIESAVRYCFPRFLKRPDSRCTDTIDNIREFYEKYHYTPFSLPQMGFLNNGNLKYYYYNILYHFSDNAFRKKVYRRDLSLPMFTAKDANKLLFIGDDLTYIPTITKDSVQLLNDNFNYLASLLNKRGIKLCFMPVVDKYDLYSEFIIENPYPKNTFFEELRKLPKKYMLIDTKAILLEEVRKGEKDIFYADDSHWTCKAEKKIFTTIKFTD